MLLALLMMAQGQAAIAAVLPDTPQVYVDSTYSEPAGAIIVVNSGDNFQAALDRAQLGDKIVLQAGAIFTGPFILPRKSSGTGWIYIISSGYDGLPPPGTRVSPLDAGRMPKLQIGVAGRSALEFASAAHHFRFVGIEIKPVDGMYINTLVAIGGNDTSVSTLPTDITFDRCYIHGDAANGSRRGIAAQGIRVAVVDSYLSDFKEDGADTQAFWSFNTPGPLKVVNNYLEAAGENLMIGGAAPQITGVVPSDIEIRGNLFAKPLAWVGQRWTIKNLIEFKLGIRVLVHQNTFENNWPQAQHGFAVQITPRNENGTATWAVTKDITFSSNSFSNVGSGFNISGTDGNYPSQRTDRVLIRDNLIQANGFNGGDGKIFQIIGGPLNLTISHNTGFGVQAAVMSENVPKADAFAFENNILTFGRYGFTGTNTSDGLVALNTYYLNWQYNKNAFIGAQVAGGSPDSHPPGNYFPATIADVGFVASAAGNYQLSSASAYYRKGTDGKDLGADISLLPSGAATRNVQNSSPPSPPAAIVVN